MVKQGTTLFLALTERERQSMQHFAERLDISVDDFVQQRFERVVKAELQRPVGYSGTFRPIDLWSVAPTSHFYEPDQREREEYEHFWQLEVSDMQASELWLHGVGRGSTTIDYFRRQFYGELLQEFPEVESSFLRLRDRESVDVAAMLRPEVRDTVGRIGMWL